MLKKTTVGQKSFEDYRNIILPELYDKIKDHSKKLLGLKVIHLNATAVGGGVAEILMGLVPLMNDIGMQAEWLTIPHDDNFFEVTKEIHNMLQGKKVELTDKQKQIFLDYKKNLAKLMDKHDADIWVIHDPQPSMAIDSMEKNVNAVWRCHIDTTNRQESVWQFIRQGLGKYKYYIFSLEQFVPEDLDKNKIVIIPPAIDPLSEKNKSMDIRLANDTIKKFGIDTNKPLLTQVSRFDPWKDPKGVIDAFRIAKKSIPDLQLAMAGLIIAKDDPEAYAIFDNVKTHANGEKDIFLFADPADIPVDNATFIKSLLTSSDVIIQKSTREGFGLVVTEAMWKGNPVIGGNVGGIKIQIEDGVSGFLVNSVEEAAEKIVYLFENNDAIQEMGINAQETIRQKFLLPRLLNDYLEVFLKMI